MILLLGLILFSQPDSDVYKREGTLITATKTDEPIEHLGKCMTVITREEIERDGSPTVFDILRNHCGLHVVQKGPFGGFTEVHIRGIEGNHTLVLIDGVKVNNPISVERSFDWGALSTAGIERIEIIRGPVSSIYGSGAIGGVINIITRKGKKGNKFDSFVSGGGYNTFEERAGVIGGTDNFDYAAFLFNINSQGLSKALLFPDSIPAPERDGYSNNGFYTKINTQLPNNLSLGTVLGYRDSKIDIDDGPFKEDLNAITSSNSKYGSIYLSQKVTNLWSYKLSVDASVAEGDTEDEIDASDTTEFTKYFNSYEGHYVKTELQNSFQFNKSLRVITGLEYGKETGEDCDCYRTNSNRVPITSINRTSLFNRSAYMQIEPSYKNLFINLSGRIDKYETHNRYPEVNNLNKTWLFSMAYLFKNTRLKANYGTGFKAPSLYQLFSPAYGNSTLLSENNIGYDVGGEHRFKDGMVEVTYFNQHIIDGIEIRNGRYKNIGGIWCTDGIEFYFLLLLSEDLSTDISFTGTDRIDWPTAYLLIPSLDYRWGITYKGLNIKFCCIGKRQDIDNSLLVDIKSCRKIDITNTFNFKKIKLQLRIENLINEDYMEAVGYSIPGRGIYLGISY